MTEPGFSAHVGQRRRRRGWRLRQNESRPFVEARVGGLKGEISRYVAAMIQTGATWNGKGLECRRGIVPDDHPAKVEPLTMADTDANGQRSQAPRPAASILAGLAVVALAASAFGQDTHYWSIAYGPIGQLVGGQAIASSLDLSATFYNPGALAMKEQAGFLLSTESFQIESVSVLPAPGLEVLDTSSSRIGAAPSLLAGVLPRWLGPDTRLAWSFLTRQEFEPRLGRRLTNPIALPGVTSAAESYYDESIDEKWGGLTASRRLSERWGVGLTWYGVYRGQRSREELSLLATAEGGAALSALGVSEFDYYHVRTLAKLGVAHDDGRLQLGLSVTTPSLGLFGSGAAGNTTSLLGVDANGDGFPDPPFLETTTQDGLAAEYRSSWAVGAGASWQRGGTRLHLSAEWFAPVGRFTVLSLPPDESGSTSGVELTQQLASVFNAGVGVQHDFGSDMALYGAFRTDFSASVGDPTVNAAVSDWDLYHLSAGFAFRIGDSRFTLGATGSFGGHTRPLATPIPPEDLPGAGLDAPVEIRYRRLVFLLGFLLGGS